MPVPRPDWWIAMLVAGGMSLWVLGASIATRLPPFGGGWLDVPGNSLRLALWLSLGVTAWMSWLVADDAPLGLWRQELTLLALTVIGIDEVQRRRAWQERKRDIIAQMGSHSNEFALDAVRIITNEDWLCDGSLKGAYLGGANLQGARLWGANLQGAYLLEPNLQGAVLNEANLQDAILGGANLQDAHLLLANLQGALLHGANLQDAVLARVNLQGAHLEDANLQGAHLRGANLQGAHLVGANLDGAKYNSRPDMLGRVTIWPDGFDFKAAGAIEVDLRTGAPIDG